MKKIHTLTLTGLMISGFAQAATIDLINTGASTESATSNTVSTVVFSQYDATNGITFNLTATGADTSGNGFVYYDDNIISVDTTRITQTETLTLSIGVTLDTGRQFDTISLDKIGLGAPDSGVLYTLVNGLATNNTDTLDAYDTTGTEFIGVGELNELDPAFAAGLSVANLGSWALSIQDNDSGNTFAVRDLLIDYTTSAVPAPEPSSAALLGLGGLALMLRRRK